MRSDRRLQALRSRMAEENVELFVAQRPANVRYLTGFDNVFDEEPSSLAVVMAETAVVITDSRFEEAAVHAAEGTAWTVSVTADESFEALLHVVADRGLARVAVESSLTYGRFTRFADRCPAEVVPAEGWTERLRVVKDAEEIERIAAAQALTDRAFDHILGFASIGMTEREVALELEFFMRKNGSEGVAFPPIVASGPNSALPHAGVTDRVLGNGDLLKLDFGARIGGYCADMTRTVVLGEANSRQREIYRAVLAANEAGLEHLSAGRTGAEVDAAARDVIERAGFGDRFGHGLGHGVGLEVHEAPSVSRRGTEALPEGAVVTIEPGVYLPGFGGVRIEDLVVVNARGNRVLSRSPKSLIEL